jgi:hypothetical protein
MSVSVVAPPRFEPVKQPIPSSHDFVVVRNARRRRTQPGATQKKNFPASSIFVALRAAETDVVVKGQQALLRWDHGSNG